MKKIVINIFLFALLLSCTNKNSKTGPGSQLHNEVMEFAVRYASSKFRESKQTVSNDGIVTITDNQINYIMTTTNQVKYIVDPAKIVIGLIDDDAIEDAIITIFSFRGQYEEVPETLILIKTDGKFVLSRAVESDMKVLGIKDRLITAEILTRSRNSPLRDCNSCKEVVKYRFKTGDLVRIK
jgi:hypothetical protein